MWFKQIQLWALESQIDTNPNWLIEKLEPLRFKPCLPTLPSSSGWISPVESDDDASLVIGVNGCLMLCLQIEEKLLPAQVVNHALKEKIKQVEHAETRRVRKKEKDTYKEEITQTLLPRAFSKYSKIHGYIDTRNKLLVLNTTSAKKAELFISQLKKSLGDQLHTIEVIKPSAVMTEWLKNQTNPSLFAIEKFCLLQDPSQENRVIRCQQQNLFAEGIQSLMKDGCDVVQLSISWHDKLQFVLTNEFYLKNIQRVDDDLVELQDEYETPLQKFAADFLILSQLLGSLLENLLEIFAKELKIISSNDKVSADNLIQTA